MNIFTDNSDPNQFDTNQFLIDENNVIPDDLTKTVNKEETYINFDEVEEDINL